MPDIELTCVQCKQTFLFSDKEQDEFYRFNKAQPQRCAACRPSRKKTAALAANGETGKAARYEIVCDRCGKRDSVPFPPKPGREVLCGDCFGASRIRKNG